MPKRKLEDELEEDWADAGTQIKPDNKKNSLDSDEEDYGEERTYDILAEDEIEGQEEGAAGFDGEVRITPFNMKEELEEGHFDTEGNYHWKKEGQIRDNWLENIDWVKIKKTDEKPEGAEGDKDDSDSDYSNDASPFDRIAVYKQMLELMKPGESVAKSLRRLGGNKNMSASERWRRKKDGEGDHSKEENRQQVTELTELANRLLTRTGNMNIYQEGYEHITMLIEDAERQNVKSQCRPATDYEDALDMYADDFDEKEKARMEKQADRKKENEEDTTRMASGKPEIGKATGNGNVEVSSSSGQEESAEVLWEFKWDAKSMDIRGPHTTSQMQAWVDEGYFKKSVLVRKFGTNGQFYNSSRVDFELYL